MIISGNNLVVYDNDIALGHTTSCAISFTMDTPDATSKYSQGWKEVIAGKRDASIRAEGCVDYSQQFGFEDWVTQIITHKYTKWVFQDATSFYMGGGYIKDVEQVSDFETATKFSLDIVIVGQIYVEPRLPWNLVFANWENININWENV